MLRVGECESLELKEVNGTRHAYLQVSSMSRHWRRKWQPTPVFLPGKSHGWRSLGGCSPWGRKESDTTEQLHSLALVQCMGISLLWLLLLQSTGSRAPGLSNHGHTGLAALQHVPWGREESDKTQQLHFHFSLSCIGGGNGNPLQCSCLENPRDRGAWWAAIYGVAQSWTRLK